MNETIGRIYRDQWNYVRNVVLRLGIAEAYADDVAQDVFVVAQRRLPSFEGRSALRTWLYGIARRVAKDHRRSAERARRRLTLVPEPLPTATPDEDVARRQAERVLGRALDHLDAKRRTIFELSEIEGLTAPQIAASLGLKTNTVYSRLRLARASFREALRREAIPAVAICAANDAGRQAPVWASAS